MDYEKICSYVDNLQEIDNKKNMNENDSYLKTLISCKRCNLPGITHGFDIYECQKCGDMLETAIDQHAEWRHYGGDGKPDPARCSLSLIHI